jgi:hypothetical protein
MDAARNARAGQRNRRTNSSDFRQIKKPLPERGGGFLF